jgi:hypothetical protein
VAAPILCNGPDGGPAAVLITMLADGDTVGLCGPCLTDWAHAIVKATAPELLAAEPAKPKRAPRKKPAAKPSPAADEPEIYEDGNTEYGIEQAEELNELLAGGQ